MRCCKGFFLPVVITDFASLIFEEQPAMTCGFRLFLFGVPYSKGDTKSSWIAAMISITKSAKHVCFIPLRLSSPPSKNAQLVAN